MNELRKARVTVSMDRDLWTRGKAKAHELNISFSGYLERLIERDISGGGDSQMDRIESKIDMIKTAFDRSFDVELEDLPVRHYGKTSPLITRYGDGDVAKGLVEDVIIPEKTWRDTDRTTRGDMAVPRSDDEVIGEAQVKLEGVRDRYKLANPRKICPLCNNFNKDCVC